MFCMNCGQKLPSGARFCLNCGTPLGVVSSSELIQNETVNLDEIHAIVPSMCPNCNAHMKVNPSIKFAYCETCGTECLVQDAIKCFTVRGNVQVGNATINVTGANTDSLLQRVEIMLGDGDFNGVMAKCDKLLDSDPTNGYIYLYMLMADLKCTKKKDLSRLSDSFAYNPYYIKAMQYGDDSLKSELSEYMNLTRKRIQFEREVREKSKDEINAKLTEEKEAKQKNPKIGDCIYFGTTNKKNMWWVVLDVKERNALIISRMIIATMPYY